VQNTQPAPRPPTANARARKTKPSWNAKPRASRRTPGLVAWRKEIVEHILGSLRNRGHARFRCRGLEMVRAEFSLSALTYNLPRALGVCDAPALLAALRPT
jgi:hypothetical protein